MNIKTIFHTGIILFPFFFGHKAHAQEGKRHNRSVTINQVVVDGKVVSADTIITEIDTLTRTVNSKEISMELPYTKGGTVHIDNAYRKINIRQSKDNKVRLVTTAFYYGEPAFTNEQWLEKLNIQMKNTDTGITIVSSSINNKKDGITTGYRIYTSDVPVPPTPPTPPESPVSGVTVRGTGSVNGFTITDNKGLREVIVNGQPARKSAYTVTGFSSGNSTAVFDEKGNVSYNSSSLKRELTIYVPAGAKIDVTSKYADVSVDHDLTSINAKMTSASLDMPNAANAVIFSTYSNISTGNIDNGDISVISGKLSMKSVNQLQLNTRYAKIEADKCNVLKLQSVSDDYDIDEIKSLSGTKNYGNLRVDKLTGNFDLKGSSADLRIRNIDPAVSYITLDNKYADIQFPVTALKNYEVAFTGNYSSVFAPFERRDTVIEKQQDEVRIITTTGKKTLNGLAAVGSVNSRRNGQSFTAAVGDTKGTHTIFTLVCNSCNVDFK